MDICDFTAVALIIVWFTIILLYASQAKKKGDLKLWHKVNLKSGFKAKDFNGKFTFSDYQKMENDLFNELHEKVYKNIAQTDKHQFTRR